MSQPSCHGWNINYDKWYTSSLSPENHGDCYCRQEKPEGISLLVSGDDSEHHNCRRGLWRYLYPSTVFIHQIWWYLALLSVQCIMNQTYVVAQGTLLTYLVRSQANIHNSKIVKTLYKLHDFKNYSTCSCFIKFYDFPDSFFASLILACS